VVRHEAEIDRQLNELTTRAGDLAFFWWQRGSVYIQARFYELLAYVASQSNRTQQGSAPRQAPVVARQGPPPRPNGQGPPRGPLRDPQQVLSESILYVVAVCFVSLCLNYIKCSDTVFCSYTDHIYTCFFFMFLLTTVLC